MADEKISISEIPARRAWRLIFRIAVICAGIFLFGYGLVAMLFDFKIGLLIAVAGAAMLFGILYHAYNP